MKVLYYSPPGFADNNFTLYKAMRDRGVDFTYLMSMMPGTTKSPVFEIKNVIQKNAIIKASEYKELQIFEKYMDFLVPNQSSANMRYNHCFFLFSTSDLCISSP